MLDIRADLNKSAFPMVHGDHVPLQETKREDERINDIRGMPPGHPVHVQTILTS